MARIRSDLAGTVQAHARSPRGTWDPFPVTLRAGDVVPAGVVVDDALTDAAPGDSPAVGDAGAGEAPGSASPNPETFDPGEHTVDDVNAYLDQHPGDLAAVLDAERAGKARKGIVEGPHTA